MIEIGNVVRYIGTEPHGWLRRGGLAKVMQISKAGRVRVTGKGGSPQWIEGDQCEFVSVNDANGMFDRKPRGTGNGTGPEHVTELEPEPQPEIDITPDPVLATAIESATRAVKVVDMWPHFDDGVPVMLGDLVSHDDMVGEVTLISFDEDGFEIGTTEDLDIELPFGETVKRGQDSMDLIWAATRDAINAGVLSRELFEQLCKRAQKLGDAS